MHVESPRRRRHPRAHPRGACAVVEQLETRRLFQGTPAGNSFTQTNLVADVASLNAAHLDTDLKNAWGVSFSPTGPFWVSANGTGKSTLYDSTGTKQSLEVTIPATAGGTATSAPTGQVFNSSNSFVVTQGTNSGPATFIFVSEDGGISGWNSGVNGTNAVLAVNNAATDAVYKGVTIGTLRHQRMLYAANFSGGKVEMYDGSFTRIGRKNGFKDPQIPRGYAPFNVQNLNGVIYVTYAKRDTAKVDDVPGPGRGFVNAYSTNGTLLRRLPRRSYLNAPWGLAVAPSNFGPFAGDLLVGQFGSGRIAAVNPRTGKLVGFLENSTGTPITIDGLWALTPGNGGSAGSTDTIFFTAGPNDEANGLFGSIAINP
jgi:uncharacterized protein (TIGR03118 family)